MRTERLRVTGGDLWGKLRQLVHEGNVRRIIIRGSDERMLIDIPVTAGVVGVVLAPFAVAVGAVAALATHCTIEIERLEEATAAGRDRGSRPGRSRGRDGRGRRDRDGGRRGSRKGRGEDQGLTPPGEAVVPTADRRLSR